MLVSTKERFFLWAPSLMFIAMVLGKFDRTWKGELIYRVLENGAVSSLFLFIAAVFITVGDPKSFRTGIVMWILALIAYFALKPIVIVTIHL